MLGVERDPRQARASVASRIPDEEEVRKAEAEEARQLGESSGYKE